MKLANDIRDMIHDTYFLKKTVLLAVPVAMQGLLNTVVNLVDNLMIGSLGATAIASVGLANKVFFVFSLLVFGVVSGSGILAAQYWGNHDVKNIRKVLGISLMIALIGAILFLIPARWNPRMVMRIFTTSESSIEMGAAYLMVAALSYPCTAVTNTYVAMLRSVNRVKEPVIISCVAILTNITFNYIFIIGHFGAPALGVVGAALATLIARILEMTLILLTVYVGKTPLACHVRELFGYSKEFLIQFARTSAPVICNEFMWGLGTTIYSMAYGRMGDEAVAAITINILHMYGSVWQSLRHAFFQVSSIITTTGYATTDFNTWPTFSKAILVTLMFVGACAGSTGGGIKVARLVILSKTSLCDMRRMLHPNAVATVRFEGKPMGDKQIRSVHLFLTVYLMVFCISCLLISLEHMDLITTFTAVASCMNNIGPGLEIVGPMGNFSSFSYASKLLLSFDMLA